MLTDIYVVFLSPSGQMLVQYLKFGHNCSLQPFFNTLLSIYSGLCSADIWLAPNFLFLYMSGKRAVDMLVIYLYR
jgi:hypothetical protein